MRGRTRAAAHAKDNGGKDLERTFGPVKAQLSIDMAQGIDDRPGPASGIILCHRGSARRMAEFTVADGDVTAGRRPWTCGRPMAGPAHRLIGGVPCWSVRCVSILERSMAVDAAAFVRGRAV